MAILGITGGIATGKSTFARELVSRANVKLFDADRAAAQLLSRADIIAEIGQTFGKDVLSKEGIVDKARLRDIIFTSEGGRDNRHLLEKILHPRIRAAWMEEARIAREQEEWFAVDIPLLFETHGERYFDSIIVVACSAQTQWERLMNERKLSEEVAREILAAQIPLEEKVARADHVIWSDGPFSRLSEQLLTLLRYLGVPLRAL